jgi:hypothetical protein
LSYLVVGVNEVKVVEDEVVVLAVVVVEVVDVVVLDVVGALFLFIRHKYIKKSTRVNSCSRSLLFEST